MKSYKFKFIVDDLDSCIKGHHESFNVKAETRDDAFKVADKITRDRILDLIGKVEEYTLECKGPN